MKKRVMTDREVYPAVWILVGVLALGYLIWRYVLGSPAVSRCWVWEHWGVYCPGCGGTRAVIALAHGRLIESLYYHPAVPAATALGATYLLSQTVWRLRCRRGWVLRYDPRWPALLVGLFLVNCAVRNVLWLGFGIPL